MSYKDIIDNLYLKEDPWGTKTVYAEQMRFKNSFNLIPPKSYSSILELGCSEGVFTSKLIDIGETIYAVDISEVAINRAKTYLREKGEKVNFSVADITKLKFKPQSFDLICCLALLYFPPRITLKEIMANLSTFLKKDGYIIFCEAILPGYFEYQELIDLVSREFTIIKVEPVTSNLFKLGGLIKRMPLLAKTGIYELAMVITRKFPKQLVRHLGILATKKEN